MHLQACVCGRCSTMARSRLSAAYGLLGRLLRGMSLLSPPLRMSGHLCMLHTLLERKEPSTISTAMLVCRTGLIGVQERHHCQCILTLTVRERITRAQLRAPGGPSYAWHTLWWAGNATQLYAVAPSATCVVHIGSAPVVVCRCSKTNELLYTAPHSHTEHYRREGLRQGVLSGGC